MDRMVIKQREMEKNQKIIYSHKMTQLPKKIAGPISK
jgi:hypothetical protein